MSRDLRDLVTFFCPQGKVNHQSVLTDGSLAYTRHALDAKALQTPGTANLGDVVRGRGGGVLAWTTNGKLHVQFYPPGGAQPPRQVLVISRGGHEAQAITDGMLSLDLERGQHVVVPVDTDAEARLGQLVGALQFLPDDTVNQLLTVIRRPAIELRLGDIEDRLSAVEGGGRPKPSTSALPTLLRDWRTLVILAVVVVASIAIGAVVPWPRLLSGWLVPPEQTVDDTNKTSQKREKQPSTPNGDPGRASSPSTPADPPPATASTLDEGEEALIQAMAAAPEDSPLRKLHTSHVGSKDLRDVSAAVRAWLLIKVELLRMGNLPDDSPAMVTGPAAIAAARTLLVNGVGGPVKTNVGEPFADRARRLMALAGCRAWSLPGVPKNENMPALTFESLSCANVQKDAGPALRELSDLATWVKARQ
jgi:hypothetical protein